MHSEQNQPAHAIRIGYGQLVWNLIPVVLFLGLLAYSAWIRFDGITTQGITGGDSYDYVREAQLWANGEPPKFYEDGQFHRPPAGRNQEL